jgi:hypothetical protein
VKRFLFYLWISIFIASCTIITWQKDNKIELQCKIKVSATEQEDFTKHIVLNYDIIAVSCEN